MRAWKIHLGWGLVAIVTAAAWGRWTAAHRHAGTAIRLPSNAAAPEDPPQVRSDSLLPPTIVDASQARPSLSPLRLLPDPYDLPLEEIREKLKSPSARDVLRALEAIIKLSDVALKRELLLDCLRSTNYQVRRRAMTALVPVMGEDAIPVVQGVLLSDPMGLVREQAAELLGGLSDRGSTAMLLDAYRTGEGDLKVAAAASLHRLGDPAPASELLAVLAADLDSPDGAVRKDAVERIGRLQAPIALPVLARALRDSSGDVRSEAASALGDIDTPEIPALLAPLLKDPFVDVRESAQDAIDTYRKRHPK